MSQSLFQGFALELLATSGVTGFHNIAQVILYSWMRRSGRFKTGTDDLQLEYQFYDANKPTDKNVVYADAVGVRMADGVMEIFEVKPMWHLDVPQKLSMAVAEMEYYVTIGCGQRLGEDNEKYQAMHGVYLYLGGPVKFYEDTNVIYSMQLSYKGGVIGYRIERQFKNGQKNKDLRVEQAKAEMERTILPRYRAGLDTDNTRALAEQFGETVLIVGYASVAAYAAGSAVVGGSIVSGLDEVVIVSDAIAKSTAVEAAKAKAEEVVYMLFVEYGGKMVAVKALFEALNIANK